MVHSGEGATDPEAEASRIGVRAFRRLGGPQNRGLLVADPPIPGRDERPLPHTGLGVARGLLVRVVVVAEPRVGQRPSASHHPFLDVLAVDLASRHHSAAAVGGRACMAGPALAVGMLDQFVARRGPAGPALALAVEAELIDRRRVDGAEPDTAGSDQDGIAVADLRVPVMSAACATTGRTSAIVASRNFRRI